MIMMLLIMLDMGIRMIALMPHPYLAIPIAAIMNKPIWYGIFNVYHVQPMTMMHTYLRPDVLGHYCNNRWICYHIHQPNYAYPYMWYKTLKGKNIEPLPSEMYAFYIERVREQLHVALAFSPIGESFKERIRMYPSLINCCTIDW